MVEAENKPANERSYQDDLKFIERVSSCCYKIKKGFVPNITSTKKRPAGITKGMWKKENLF